LSLFKRIIRRLTRELFPVYQTFEQVEDQNDSFQWLMGLIETYRRTNSWRIVSPTIPVFFV